MTSTDAPTANPFADIVDVKWHERYPELGRGPIPADIYYSDEYFAEEMKVYRQSWLNVGRVEEVPRPGSFKVVDLGALGGSIIVTRDRAGDLHAVHNICSHRGNVLLTEPSGETPDITCGYHGWRFRLDGSCDFIPDEANFVGAGSLPSKECANLPTINIGEVEGFIFINLAERPAQSLDEYLGPLMADLHGYPFQQFSAAALHYSAVVEANWKLCRDAFIEVIHAPYVHGESVPNAVSGTGNPYGHLLDVEAVGPHLRIVPPSSPDYEQTLMEEISYRRRGGLEEFDRPKGLNPTGHPYWLQDNYTFFPNFLLDLSAGQIFGTYYSYNIWPISPNRTRFEHHEYFPAPSTAGVRVAQEMGRVLLRDGWQEDFRILEGQHRAIASGVNKVLHLADQEIAIRHQHETMNAAIRAINEAGSR